MKKITIAAYPDNSYNVKVDDGELLSVAWRDKTHWVLSDPLGDFKMDFGNEVLPDWTSILQYLQELN